MLVLSSLSPNVCRAQSEKFIMENQNLTSIPTESIGAGVYFVSLNRNNITSVEAYAFNRSYIATIKLSYNKITYVDPYAFYGTVLEHCDLVYNQLAAIPDFSIMGSTLNVINLGHNRITSVPPSSFSSLSNLQRLTLNANNLVAFPNLRAAAYTLTILIIGGVPDLVPTDINYYENLQLLALLGGTHTRFPNLTAMPCAGTLKTLWLSYHVFSTIDPKLLNPLVGLAELKITNDQLSSLPILTPLCSLKRLYADNNNISVITAEHFEGLNYLESIRITNNRLTSFPDVHYLSGSLTNINLGQNSITNMPNDWLIDLITGMQTLQSIGLEGNNLTIVPDIYHGLLRQSVQILDLKDNQLVCNCSLTWLKDANNSSLTVLLDVKPCSAPDEFANMDWTDITWEMMCPCES